MKFVVDGVTLRQVYTSTSSFHQCSKVIFIYMLLLPEGQTVEAWESSKSNALSEIGKRGTRKVFSLFLVFEGLTDNVKSVNMPVISNKLPWCRGPADMGCDTVGMELCNRSIYSRNTQCIVDVEHDCMYQILRTASHTKKLQCRRGIP